MRGTPAVFLVAFRGTTRSHPMRALAAALLLASTAAPSVVAFTFHSDDALAVSGAFGSASLLAPLGALLGGVLLATGENGGEGLAPLLRGPASPAPVAAAAAAGVAAAAIALAAIAALAAAVSLLLSGDEFPAARCAGALLASFASAPAAAAAGIVLAVAVPRPLAAALAFLLGAAALAGPAAIGASSAPSPAQVILLSRDAAFGALPASAVALSCAASAAAAAGLVAAATALLRVKDLAPRPGGA